MSRPKKKKDLVTATATGDRLETLIALRDLLAERLQTTQSSRDISSMSRRLMQCVAEIEDLQRNRRALASGRTLNELRRSIARSKITAEHDD